MLERLLKNDSLCTLSLRREQFLRWIREKGVSIEPNAYLVYHSGYLNFQRQHGERFTFDIQRPARILEELSRVGLLSSNQVLVPTFLDRATLELVHSSDYLDRLCDEKLLAKALEVNDSECNLIEPFIWQSAGSIRAAEHALRTKKTTINLGGGFHHSSRDKMEGFGPINDIALAATYLCENHLAKRILIIDADFHQGFGTANIFSNVEDVFTLSIHGKESKPSLVGKNLVDVLVASNIGDQGYLRQFKQSVNDALRSFKPEITIYLAGVDPWSSDRYGNLGISEDTLLARDCFLKERMAALDIPLAVLLGGGYGPISWCISYNFIFTLLTGKPPAHRYRPSNIGAKYERVHRRIHPNRLGLDEKANELDSELLMQLGGEDSAGGKFLDFYTRDGIEYAMEQYGFFDLLREKGFDDFLLSVDTVNKERHIVRLHYKDREPEHLLIELAAHLCELDYERFESNADGFKFQRTKKKNRERYFKGIHIDWLLMQNPKEEFGDHLPAMPGQNYPGLGLFRWFGEILRLTAMRLKCDLIINHPERFHNAHLYGKVMKFIDPHEEGRFRALERDLDALPLVKATRALEEKRVVYRDSEKECSWGGGEQPVGMQILGITPPVIQYFLHQNYLHKVERAQSEYHFKWLE